MSGKGSKPRPMKVSIEEFEDNWETAFFGKKKHKQDTGIDSIKTNIDQPEVLFPFDRDFEKNLEK